MDEFQSADGSYTYLLYLHESEMADISDCITALKGAITSIEKKQ